MNNTVLCFDAGNTHLVMGLYCKDNLSGVFRLESKARRTADEMQVFILNWLKDLNIEPSQVDTIALASVVPDLTRVVSHVSQKYYKANFINVNALTPLGLTYPISDPAFIGADLVVNAYAAHKKYKGPTIVCDFGTATTIQLVGGDGYFYGTAIIPGMISGAESLFNNAALLSKVELDYPEEILGTSTARALRSGIVGGHAYIVEGFVRDIRAKYSHLGPIKAIATGGIAPLVVRATSAIDAIDKNLTLEGLYRIATEITT